MIRLYRCVSDTDFTIKIMEEISSALVFVSLVKEKRASFDRHIYLDVGYLQD